MVHSRLQPQLLAQQKAQFDTKSTAKQPVFKIILTAFRLSPVFSETNFANFQICLGFRKGFVENLARILRGVKSIFGLCIGGGGCLVACLPAGLPSGPVCPSFPVSIFAARLRVSVHLCGLSFPAGHFWRGFLKQAFLAVFRPFWAWVVVSFI